MGCETGERTRFSFFFFLRYRQNRIRKHDPFYQKIDSVEPGFHELTGIQIATDFHGYHIGGGHRSGGKALKNVMNNDFSKSQKNGHYI